MTKERLTICFHPWILFNKTDEYFEILSEIKERGFNCIRFEDGAGILWDEDGKERKNVKIHPPFGKYTKYTSFRTFTSGTINPLERLVKICRTASQLGIQVILSSWYYMHTYWFLEDKETETYFNFSPEEKISFFTSELDKILSVLRDEGLIDVVAFAEIFNEFDNLPWYRNDVKISEEEAPVLRCFHERAIQELKEKHPDVLFGFDTMVATPIEDLIPRNIDVFNFHLYYAWSTYFPFEQGICVPTLSVDEPEFSDETKFFLVNDRIMVKDVVEEMVEKIRTRPSSWPRRIALYASIDHEKEVELTKFLDKSLQEDFDSIKDKITERINKMLEIHDKIVPNSKIVMGEGVMCCTSPTLPFERDSMLLWDLIEYHMNLLREIGAWGSIISTCHAPERNAAWALKDKYVKINNDFLCVD